VVTLTRIRGTFLPLVVMLLAERPRKEEEEALEEEPARAREAWGAAAAVRALRALVVMAAILGCGVSVGVVRASAGVGERVTWT
jgi:hypothetical protein